MAFPGTPLDLRLELLIDGVWSPVPTYERDSVRVETGRGDQATQTDPGSLSITINNRAGRCSPLNPESDLYGKIGRNTRCRLSVPGSESYLELNGNAADNASTPDTAALDITGDLDLRWEGEADWYDSGAQILIGKWGASGNRSYHLRLDGGLLYLHATTDGTIGPVAGAALPALPRRAAVRATLDVDNGAGGCTIRLYWAHSLDGPWTQAGEPVSFTGTWSVFAGTAPLTIAPEQIDTFATRRPVTGRVYRAEVRNGIDGPLAAAPDFRALPGATTAFTDTAGRVWTVTGLAAVRDRDDLFNGEVSEWPQQWQPDGSDAWVPLQASGILRRLGQGRKALQSTLRRRIPSGQPLAYWPMEDGASAVQAAPALDGGRPLAVSGLSFASETSLPSSDALPTLDEQATLSGSVPGAVAGGWHVEMVYKLDALPAAEQTMLTVQLSPGTGGVRQVRARVSATAIKVEALDGEDAVVAWFQHTGAGLSDFTGEWNRLQIFSSVSGSQARVNLAWRDVNNRVWWYVFAAWTGTPGRITGVRGSWGSDFQGMAIGHLAAFDTGGTTAPAPGVTIYEGSDDGFTGETAWTRMRRLADEENLQLARIPGPEPTQKVGPQTIDTLLNLLQAAADADGGLLLEDRRRPGLLYRDRTSMYSQTPALVLSYDQAPGLAAPLTPVDDDTAVRNDRTVQRDGGSEGRAVLEEGPLSVQEPPDGIGLYDDSVTLSLHDDAQTEPIAYWLLHLGTYDGPRYPSVRIMLHKAPHLIPAVLALTEGDLIRITDLPKWVGYGNADLIVDGIHHDVRSTWWEVEFNCSPGQPWQVGAVEDTLLGRVDTDGSQLAAPAGAADTTLLVQATAGPEWVTTAAHPGEFPFDIRVGGEVMTVTAIADAAADAFGRTVASGWGVSDTGQAWTTSGGAASDYAVGSGVGSHTMTSTNLSRRSLLTQPSADFDLMVDLSTSVLSTGGFQSGGLIARAADSNNLFLARLEFTAAQAIVLTLRKRLTGTETVLGTYTLPLTHAAATYYRLRFQGQGSALRARAWRAGDPDPVTWQVTATDTDLAAAAEMGVRSILSSANTNTSPVMRYDNLRVVTPQRFTVTRAVNGVVKAHTAGTDVRLATPMTIAL